jgi:hypothetical protein
VTRVLVARQPDLHRHGDPDGLAGGPDDGCGPHDPDGYHGHDLRGHDPSGHGDPGQGDSGLAERLQTAMARLPRAWAGPSQPLDLGRTTRVVHPTQPLALAVRDGGGGVPGCARPLAGGEAQQLWPWLDGGPTDLEHLVLVGRALIGRSMRAAGG